MSFSLGNVSGGRAGGAEPPPTCQLPAQTVPGWRPFGFPPALCEAQQRMPEAGVGVEETEEVKPPP